MAFVGLAAKMAKADGVAVDAEAAAFERLIDAGPDEREQIHRLYSLAKQDVSGFESYAAKIARLLKDEPAMLRHVLECLFVIATADGVLHAAEDKFLREVGDILGVSRQEQAAMRSLFVRDPTSPYEVLGVSPGLSDGEIRVRYLELVRRHHPDALAADGVPAAYHAAADRKLAAINAAYDEIQRQRAMGRAQV